MLDHVGSYVSRNQLASSEINFPRGASHVSVRRTTFHYEGVIRELCRTPRAERARRDLINFAGEMRNNLRLCTAHRAYVMFNHVRIIKQLFVTLDGNRRNLITHEEAVYRAAYATRLYEIMPCEYKI